jgi:alanine-synthesizing transaminase
VRLAFVENEQRIRQAARNVKKLLGSKGGQGNVVPLAANK